MKIGIETKQRAARIVKERNIDVAPLARKVGVSQSTLWNFLFGKTHNFGNLQQLAVEIGVSLDWLLNGDEIKKEIDSHAQVVEQRVGHSFSDTIPVLGSANGSSEALVLNFDDPIADTPRHPEQEGFKNAFAMYVIGDSMTPRHRPGEKVYALASLMPKRGQDCIVEMQNGEGYIKTFEEKTKKEVICTQLNPEQKWKRLLSDVKAIHAVVR